MYPLRAKLSWRAVLPRRQWATASCVAWEMRAWTIWAAEAAENPYRWEKRVTSVFSNRVASRPCDPRVSRTKGTTWYPFWNWGWFRNEYFGPFTFLA